MEKNIEKLIDNLLDSTFGSISSKIYLLNIGAGIVLIIIGIIIISQKRSSARKVKRNIGLICMGLGIVALLSGSIQRLAMRF